LLKNYDERKKWKVRGKNGKEVNANHFENMGDKYERVMIL
jgi:hypothetical protein